jgi:CheY-like chemotaxis protein
MSRKSLKVFVVEDEAMIRILVADMLGELGHTLAAEAGHIDQALELAQSTEFARFSTLISGVRWSRPWPS